MNQGEMPSLIGVVPPPPDTEHECSRDGHSYEMIESAGDGPIAMFCPHCTGSWRVEKA